MRVLITGGAGYLGSVLTRRLLKEGHDVTVLDNFLYGHGSLDEAQEDPKLRIVEGDVWNLIMVNEAVKEADAVIHLASIVGDQAGSLDPESTIITNFLVTREVAELSRLHGVKKFLFASTCSVYGNAPTNRQMKESDVWEEPLGNGEESREPIPRPISLYGETKLRSEIALRNIPDLESTVLRLGTLYGLSPRMRFDLVVNLFIAKAIKGEKLTVFGGTQYRPFLHVYDAAEAFVSLLQTDGDRVLNVASGNFRIIDIAQMIAKQFGVDTEISRDITDSRNYIASTDRMRALGIEPTKTIEDAITEIKVAFDRGLIGDYASDVYSNYKALFRSRDLQRRVYSLGPIGERT